MDEVGKDEAPLPLPLPSSVGGRMRWVGTTRVSIAVVCGGMGSQTTWLEGRGGVVACVGTDERGELANLHTALRAATYQTTDLYPYPWYSPIVCISVMPVSG